MKTLSRIIGALLLALLAGCSAVQTGYNNAPTLLYWWLDGYADFNADQATQVRASLETLQAWHRREELPAYASLLQRIREASTQALTADQVCAHLSQIRQHLQHLGAQAADGLATFAPTVQPAQLQHLERQFDKHNRLWREEWLDGTAEELLQRRLKRTLERYEDFYGRLSPTQRALLRERLANSGFDPRLAWAERLRRQQDLLRMLQEHSKGERPAHVKAEMLALVQRSLEPPEPAMRAGYEQMLREGCRSLAELHNGSSPEQKQRMASRLQAYENDVRALIAVR